jgi:hypothetical protein
MGHRLPQFAEDLALLFEGRTHLNSRPAGFHGAADMAMANNGVQLPVCQLEEAPGFAVCIILQPLRTQDWIGESDAEGRAKALGLVAYVQGHVFGTGEGAETPLGILFEKHCPTFQSLTSRHGRKSRFDLRDAMQLLNCLVSHDRLLFSRHPAYSDLALVGGQPQSSLCKRTCIRWGSSISAEDMGRNSIFRSPKSPWTWFKS